MADWPPKATGYRPRCFFDISINKVPAGRLVFELFADIAPKTCENFRALCTGEKGEGKTTLKPLHYKGTVIHRIVREFILQGGDFSAGNGTGGESIYGGTFKDETFDLKHDRPMLLSMANRGPNTNGSQFFVTLKNAPHLDGIHCVFGHVISGEPLAREIENQKTDSNHKPYAEILIANCGELVKKSRILKEKKVKASNKKKVASGSSASSSSESSSESSTSSSEPDIDASSDDEKKRKKRSKKKKKKEEKKQKSQVKAVEADEEDETYGSVKPEEVPDVPMNNFLRRRSRTPSPKRRVNELKRKNENIAGFRSKNAGEPPLRNRVNLVSKSGRKLRGRGTMRYRTPPKSPSPQGYDRCFSRRERSPPHVSRRDVDSRYDRAVTGSRRHADYNERSRRRRSRSRSRSRDDHGSRRRRKSDSVPRRRQRSRSRSRYSSSRSRSRTRSRSLGRRRRRKSSPVSPSRLRRGRNRNDRRSLSRSKSPIRQEKSRRGRIKEERFARKQSDTDSDSDQSHGEGEKGEHHSSRFDLHPALTNVASKSIVPDSEKDTSAVNQEEDLRNVLNRTTTTKEQEDNTVVSNGLEDLRDVLLNSSTDKNLKVDNKESRRKVSRRQVDETESDSADSTNRKRNKKKLPRKESSAVRSRSRSVSRERGRRDK